MLIELGYLFACFVLGGSMFGWGASLLRDINVAPWFGVRVVVGMAVTVFFGGVLNALSLSYSPVWLLYGVVGLVLAYREVVTLARGGVVLGGYRFGGLNPALMLFFMVVAIAYLWVVAIQPDVYNLSDDFTKYFVQPIKMLETGSMFGSPLSTVGKEVLGAQGLFQAFFIAPFGIHAINVFDSIFCVVVGLILILELSWIKRAPMMGVLCACLFLFFDARYVNVSSVYSGAVIIIATMLFLNYTLSASESKNKNVIGAVIGLLFAALIAFKTPFGLFPLILYPIFLIILVFNQRSTVGLGSLVVKPTLFGLLFLSPWLFPFLSNISFIEFKDAAEVSVHPQNNMGWNYFISFDDDQYGSSPIQYTIFVLMPLLLWAGKKLLAQGEGDFPIALAGIVSLLMIYFGVVGLLAPDSFTYTSALRYASPFILALVPIVTLMIYIDFVKEELDSRWMKSTFGIIVLAACVQFYPQVNQDIKQAWECGSVLAFADVACESSYMARAQEILGEPGVDPAEQEIVRGWQGYVPEGEEVLLWIGAPHLADFNRNEIYEVDGSGLLSPWAHVPDVEYVVVQYRGVRPDSKMLHRLAKASPRYVRDSYYATLKFDSFLARVPKDILYIDGTVMVFKIKEA